MKQPPKQLLPLRRGNVIEFPIGCRLRPPATVHHTIKGRPASWLALAALIVRASRRVRQGWEAGERPDRVDLVFELCCLAALSVAVGSVIWGVWLIAGGAG